MDADDVATLFLGCIGALALLVIGFVVDSVTAQILLWGLSGTVSMGFWHAMLLIIAVDIVVFSAVLAAVKLR